MQYLSACSFAMYISKHFKLWKVPAVVGIIIVGILIKYVLVHFMCDLKAVQMNVQWSLIQELMIYTFELGLTAIEATKNHSYFYWVGWSWQYYLMPYGSISGVYVVVPTLRLDSGHQHNGTCHASWKTSKYGTRPFLRWV